MTDVHRTDWILTLKKMTRSYCGRLYFFSCHRKHCLLWVFFFLKVTVCEDQLMSREREAPRNQIWSTVDTVLLRMVRRSSVRSVYCKATVINNLEWIHIVHMIQIWSSPTYRCPHKNWCMVPQSEQAHLGQWLKFQKHSNLCSRNCPVISALTY